MKCPLFAASSRSISGLSRFGCPPFSADSGEFRFPTDTDTATKQPTTPSAAAPMALGWNDIALRKLLTFATSAYAPRVRVRKRSMAQHRHATGVTKIHRT